MKPERQRIVIAEFCGWECVKDGKWSVILTPSGDKLWHYDARGNSYGPCSDWNSAFNDHWDVKIPDYLKDLNAINEVKKKLGIDQFRKFEHRLGQIVFRDCPESAWEDNAENAWQTSIHCASAAQECEALLKTIEKWEE